MDEEYIRRSDVNRVIDKRIALLKEVAKSGKARSMTIINLSEVKAEIQELYSVKVKFKEEPPIWKKS